jgi:hypothetical protein
MLLNVSGFRSVLIVVAKSERPLCYAERHRRLSIALTPPRERTESPHNAGGPWGPYPRCLCEPVARNAAVVVPLDPAH